MYILRKRDMCTRLGQWICLMSFLMRQKYFQQVWIEPASAVSIGLFLSDFVRFCTMEYTRKYNENDMKSTHTKKKV